MKTIEDIKDKFESAQFGDNVYESERKLLKRFHLEKTETILEKKSTFWFVEVLVVHLLILKIL